VRVLRALSLAIWGLFCLSATTVQAQTFQDCHLTQQEIIQSVLPRAEDLASRASAAIGDTEIYTRWFGPYLPKYAENVRSNFKRIHRAIAGEELVFICGAPRSADCIDTYAFVYTSEHYTITLCPNFFDMPIMTGGSSTHPDYENGTMAGTIIHEMSHFDVTASTDDICYSRRDCSAMGRRSPDDAVINADTYQYFAEDVTFAFVASQEQPVADVPAAVPEKP
jgi:peptidyl-Lys metalloendopeptidase